MIRLMEPSEKYINSYINAYDEYMDNHVITYAFDDARSYDIFVKYDNYKNERNLKPNRVGADYYWLVDDEKDFFIGEVSIRHKLTDTLLRYGGHIGYGIRYSEWNKGYGTRPEIFYNRIKNGWMKFRNEILVQSSKDVVLVTHGGVMEVILCIENGIEYSNKTKHFATPNAKLIPRRLL